METDNNEKVIRKAKGLYITGTLGCIIGATVGTVPWMYALYSGRYVAPLALFIGLFADLFYRICYGKRRWKKIFVILPVVLIMLCASTLAIDVYTVYETVSSGAYPGIEVSEVESIFRNVLLCSDGYVMDTLGKLGYAAIFAVAGSMTMWIGLRTKRKDSKKQ